MFDSSRLDHWKLPQPGSAANEQGNVFFRSAPISGMRYMLAVSGVLTVVSLVLLGLSYY